MSLDGVRKGMLFNIHQEMGLNELRRVFQYVSQTAPDEGSFLRIHQLLNECYSGSEIPYYHASPSIGLSVTPITSHDVKNSL